MQIFKFFWTKKMQKRIKGCFSIMCNSFTRGCFEVRLLSDTFRRPCFFLVLHGLYYTAYQFLYFATALYVFVINSLRVKKKFRTKLAFWLNYYCKLLEENTKQNFTNLSILQKFQNEKSITNTRDVKKTFKLQLFNYWKRKNILPKKIWNKHKLLLNPPIINLEG